jgi:two-component system, OmpR family, response regulator ResD
MTQSDASSAISILVVDDEATIRDVIRRYLERDGFVVREAADGYAALDALAEAVPDLIVLDLMLPGIDGLTLTRQIRTPKPPSKNPAEREAREARHRVPIVMLTARGETSDRIRGLDTGADDYLAKPFSPQELVSRIRAVLRRAGEAAEPAAGQAQEFGELSIDPAARSVSVGGQPVGLTAKEFDLLWFLARHPRQVFSRSQLLDSVWGQEFYGDASTVTVHIRRLREKIEADASQPRYVVTVWGVGYKFDY